MHIHAYTHRSSARLLAHNTRCRVLKHKKFFSMRIPCAACPFAHPSLGPFAASNDVITRSPESHSPDKHFSITAAGLRPGPTAVFQLHTPRPLTLDAEGSDSRGLKVGLWRLA